MLRIYNIMSDIIFNEDNLMVRCSAIRTINGTKTFMVNYDYFDKDVSKQCGIQLPQFSISYNDGFSEDEISELIRYTDENLDPLIDMALSVPAPDLDDDNADGDCSYD